MVCLGATAGQALIGPAFRVTREHGQVRPSILGTPAIGTLHPSAVLRARTSEDRTAMLDELVADLRNARKLLEARPQA